MLLIENILTVIVDIHYSRVSIDQDKTNLGQHRKHEETSDFNELKSTNFVDLIPSSRQNLNNIAGLIWSNGSISVNLALVAAVVTAGLLCK